MAGEPTRGGDVDTDSLHNKESDWAFEVRLLEEKAEGEVASTFEDGTHTGAED